MSIVARSLGRIKASPTRAIAARAAAVEAMDRGRTRYAPQGGIPELREAVCRKFKRENGLDYAPAQTVITTGGKEALYDAFMASLDPGDEVIIPTPYWVSYPDMVRLGGGEPVFVDTDPARGFALSPAALEAAITSKTKWLLLNSPSNPSGALIDAASLEDIAEVLRAHPRVWVMTDDIYEHVIYEGAAFHTIAQVAPDLHERTLVVNGLSKAYCMTGWRIGFAAGPKTLIDAMIKVQSQSTSCACTISQWAGVAALDGDQSFIAKHNAVFQERRDVALSILNQSSGLHCATPGGAFYLYVDCSGVIGRRTSEGKALANDEDFVTYLLDREGVAAVHGAAFGMSPFFRISYALATEQLEDACLRIQRACGALA